MVVNRLISILDVKEEQAKAFLSFYKDKVECDELQIMVDNYCDNMVDSVMEEYKEEFKDDRIVSQLKKHIFSIGADKSYSGRRVYEALYRKLNKNINRNK